MPLESPYPMIAIEKALALVRQHVSRLPIISSPLMEALDHVLAEDVIAREAMPPFNAAAVDGYAVRTADGHTPRQLVGDQTAGYVDDIRITPGTAARVTTGAPVPSGADSVVMVEQAEVNNGVLELPGVELMAGANIRPVGQDIEPAQLVMAAGAMLGPAELGLLGTVGQAIVPVFRRPVVAVMSTGDELVEPGETPGPGQIRDANRFSLMSAVRQTGCVPLDLGIVRDKQNNLDATIERGLAEADVLLTSGGVSMGQLDLVKPYLASRGTVHFGRVNTKPGKPVTFAVVDGKPCFAMPGFPVSALVSFEIFVRPALLKMAGHTRIYRQLEPAELAHTLHHSAARTEFQRVLLTRQADGRLTASSTGFQGSGRLLSMHSANGLVILPKGQDDYPAGSVVQSLLLGPVEPTHPVEGTPLQGI